MVAAIQYDSKVWAAGVTVSWVCEARERERHEDVWRDLDRQLRSVAARRGALDAEELGLIRKAIAIQLWRPLGMTSMREYLEHAMGYGPQVAAERLRVADALEGLPAIEAALDAGDLTYSAVRELTRVATCKNEEAWLAACQGKVLRQIEELVAEREPGDGPDAPPKPQLRPKRITMDLRPAVVALMRQAHAALDAVRGERNDNNDLLAEAFRCLMLVHGGGDAAAPIKENQVPSDEKAPRTQRSTRAQIATITKCESCGQGWQLAAGRTIALTAVELETAECDSVHIGSLDGEPGRVSSTIPPATRRLVSQRDSCKCTVPWCRAAANIDVHHIVHREHGGGHEPENLTLLCSGHHDAHHRGELLIEGGAPALTFRRRHEVPHVGDRRRARTANESVPHVGDSPHFASALLALTTLGFTKHEAKTALAAALVHLPPETGLDPLLRAALRELR